MLKNSGMAGDTAFIRNSKMQHEMKISCCILLKYLKRKVRGIEGRQCGTFGRNPLERGIAVMPAAESGRDLPFIFAVEMLLSLLGMNAVGALWRMLLKQQLKSHGIT
ncbi:hypothetical protein [Candidatus Soleaferrea massiliensis]|uniref:hypothetical protein n=1 Tax=Candidatus Soleaferrea massiliensis TaxID=1470354 RepID=UPI00058E2A6D|nr:hypothetical protein [Candidatus Soleaferrea massiliensis]